MRLLYVNACVRKESRTDRIARELLKRLINREQEGVVLEEIKLDSASLLPLNEERLIKRTELITKEEWKHSSFVLARQFAQADQIVIAAPYWDGSFPSVLKIYIENIYVTGIVTRYGENGMPCGMCKAQKLYYVTTAGGPYVADYSYCYLQTLAMRDFGIPETKLIKAEMLDVQGFDAEEIVKQAIAHLEEAID